MELRLGTWVFGAEEVVVAACGGTGAADGGWPWVERESTADGPGPASAAPQADRWPGTARPSGTRSRPAVLACTVRDTAAARAAVSSGAHVLNSDDPAVVAFAAHIGVGLACAPWLIGVARASGVRPDGLISRLDGPLSDAEVAARVADGLPVSVDADAQADDLAGVLAVAALHAWRGVRIFRTVHPADVSDAVSMAAVIRGTRPPAVTRRSLG